MTVKSHRDASAVVRATAWTRRHVSVWVRNSLLFQIVATLGRNLEVAFARSTPAAWVRTLANWIRHSWLYQWLVTSPEPDVVVIDLRETVTVGPFVAVVDRVQPALERAWRDSRFRQVTARTTTAVRRTPIRVFSIAMCVALLANVAVGSFARTITAFRILVSLALLVLALLGTQVTTPWERLKEATTVQLLVATDGATGRAGAAADQHGIVGLAAASALTTARAQ